LILEAGRRSLSLGYKGQQARAAANKVYEQNKKYNFRKFNN
jgi:hypothetical protein